MSTSVPPRLWIFHRQETDHALIIRRGPGKITGFFGWNRRTNEVTVGQWMKRKVYPLSVGYFSKRNLRDLLFVEWLLEFRNKRLLYGGIPLSLPQGPGLKKIP